MENSKIKEHIINANNSKLKYISLISLGFSVFALFTDFLIQGVWREEYLFYYKVLDFAFAIISVCAVAFFWIFNIKSCKLQNIVIKLFPFLILIWSAVITGIDFTMLGFSTLLIVVLLTIFFLYLNLITSVLYFVSAGFAFVTTLYFQGTFNEPFLSMIFILIPAIGISVLISARNYKTKVNELINQEKIVEMNKRLYDSNEYLESEVEKRTNEIQISLKKAEESEKKFRSYIENAPDGVFIIDATGRYVKANKAACSFLGYSEEETINFNILDLIAEKSFEDGVVFFKTLIETDIALADLLYKNKNGSTRWLNISAVKLSQTQFLGFAKDITERKLAEKELITAKEKAEEMNRLKSSFLANMSHELRTPLMCINGYSDILQQSIGNPEFKEMARDIFKSGVRLSEALNLILDLSKLESEKVDFVYKKVDLVKETEDVLKLFKEAARKKDLFLKSSFTKSSVFIDTDGRAIRSILNNLINNAIKFTTSGGVTVEIFLMENVVEIKVIDTGIGISKDDFQIIFDEFRQVSEGISRNFEGTGLGLNITKKLVEKFGGVISLESEIGKGTTFTVKLPVTNKGTIMDVKTTFEEAQLRGATGQISIKPVALLVDDDPYAYPILKKCSEELIDLESSLDSESAFNLCNQKQFGLIFMDINLRRGIDGIQLTQKIRKISGYENIPIIAFTAYAMAGDKEEFLKAGCSHYLSKPFTLENVRNLLEEIFSGK